jgi:hypothetical protein
VSEVRLGGQKITLDGGYNVLEFDGTPVIEDNLAPANKMLGLCTPYLHLEQLPDPVTALNQSMGHSDLTGTDEEQYGVGKVPFRARILPLAKTGDKYPFAMYVYPQLVSRRCNVHVSIINLA